jgi:hypothetical protein
MTMLQHLAHQQPVSFEDLHDETARRAFDRPFDDHRRQPVREGSASHGAIDTAAAPEPRSNPEAGFNHRLREQREASWEPILLVPTFEEILNR